MVNYGQLIFNKDAKTIQRGKEWSFQKIVLGKLNIHIQKNEAELFLTLQKLTQNGPKT